MNIKQLNEELKKLSLEEKWGYEKSVPILDFIKIKQPILSVDKEPIKTIFYNTDYDVKGLKVNDEVVVRVENEENSGKQKIIFIPYSVHGYVEFDETIYTYKFIEFAKNKGLSSTSYASNINHSASNCFYIITDNAVETIENIINEFIEYYNQTILNPYDDFNEIVKKLSDIYNVNNDVNKNKIKADIKTIINKYIK